MTYTISNNRQKPLRIPTAINSESQLMICAYNCVLDENFLGKQRRNL